MFLQFESLPPESGKVHFTAQAEAVITYAQELENGEHSRTISDLAEIVTTALLTLSPIDFVNEGTSGRTALAHSLWEGHPILSHQPSHGAFIAGIHDASNKFHKLFEFTETGVVA